MQRRNFLKNMMLCAGMITLPPIITGCTPLADPRLDQKNTSLEHPFTFCVIADPHCAGPAMAGIEDWGSGKDKFLYCLEQIEQLEGEDKPDFILLLGDINLWVIKEELSQFSIPIHAVAGNSESTKERRQELRTFFPDDFKIKDLESDYYSFVHKGARFIGLCNASGGGDHMGHLSSEFIQPRGQCRWLEKELNKPEEIKFIFAHIPPQPEGLDQVSYMCRNDSLFFNSLVDTYQPTAMFFGHLHVETHEISFGNTRSFNVRACCWNSDESDLGFTLVKLTATDLETQEISCYSYPLNSPVTVY